MTKQKTFKRRVRTRMAKTSESYSAARRQLLAKSTPAGTAEPRPAMAESEIPTEQPAADSGTGVSAELPSPQAVTEKTGGDWDHWFGLLDGWGASDRSHSDIARWLSDEHGVSSWWAQSITVAYERARGLRAPGQGRDGRYAISASRTVNVPVEVLYDAVADSEFLDRWLTGAPLKVTTATPHKSVRGRWKDSDSRVAIGFVDKGGSKSVIGLAHERLPDPDAARQAKEYWTERLAELKKLLES